MLRWEWFITIRGSRQNNPMRRGQLVRCQSWSATDDDDGHTPSESVSQPRKSTTHKTCAVSALFDTTTTLSCTHTHTHTEIWHTRGKVTRRTRNASLSLSSWLGWLAVFCCCCFFFTAIVNCNLDVDWSVAFLDWKVFFVFRLLNAAHVSNVATVSSGWNFQTKSLTRLPSLNRPLALSLSHSLLLFLLSALLIYTHRERENRALLLSLSLFRF